MDFFKNKLSLPTKGMSSDEINKRRNLISSALRFFIDETKLQINSNQKQYLLDQLFTIFWTVENLQENDVVEYIYDIYDFNNTGDPDKIIESIILSADIKPKYRTERDWIIAFILVIIIAIAYVQSRPSPSISFEQSIELKNLVAKISKCMNVSHMKLWKDIKNLEQIKENGDNTSYKKFNVDQFNISKNWLKKQELECK